MNPTIPSTALQLRSLVQADGTLQISLEPTPVPVPGDDEVLIQVINQAVSNAWLKEQGLLSVKTKFQRRLTCTQVMPELKTCGARLRVDCHVKQLVAI